MEDNWKQSCIIAIHDLSYYLNDQHHYVRYFIYQHCKYTWDSATREFHQLDPVAQKYQLEYFTNNAKSLSYEEQNEL